MVDYSLLSFVLRGEMRKLILLYLDKPKIPKQLAEECKISIHNVSKSLNELIKGGLIRCKNPSDKFNRFYELTEKWKKLAKEVSKEK